MLKKLTVLMLLAAVILLTGCGSSPAPVMLGDFTREPTWTNPEFNMDEVVEIGDVWQLDLTALAPISWSDNDRFSMNPTEDVAEVSVNPNGGYDFTFTKYNQRIIFILDSSQRHVLRGASNVSIQIDGEATEHTNGFRYHIGWSELGSSWNASNSPNEGPFSSILESRINISGNPTEREEKIVNFMIQSRGGEIGKPFDPVTVTIRSITFSVGRN